MTQPQPPNCRRDEPSRRRTPFRLRLFLWPRPRDSEPGSVPHFFHIFFYRAALMQGTAELAGNSMSSEKKKTSAPL